VKPSAAPAYTLAGWIARIFAPVEIATLAVPDCEGSSELTAITCIEFGDGAEAGAE
jgi:hypothetical protein